MSRKGGGKLIVVDDDNVLGERLEVVRELDQHQYQAREGHDGAWVFTNRRKTNSF